MKIKCFKTHLGEDGHKDDFLNPPTSLSRDLGEALKMSDFTDMTIVCEKKEFRCHKFILAARYHGFFYHLFILTQYTISSIAYINIYFLPIGGKEDKGGLK